MGRTMAAVRGDQSDQPSDQYGAAIQLLRNDLLRCEDP
ncbi:MAG: hypothetical protein OJF58_002265 [Enhydrobacter sp.]|nr:MAG: hypothetical protein OJF58_002265 [Enhydrobacter sp.]